MSENKTLREAIKRLLKAHRITVQAPPKTITDAENQIAEIQNAVKFAEQALALPTAEVMTNGLTQSETDASASVSGLTAAPVGDREAFEDLIEEFEAAAIDKHDCRNPEYEFEHRAYDSACQRYDEARAALSAGDAGWQPIDTAPKDGSDCWLLVEEEVRRGFWVEIEFEERRDLDGRYIDQTDDDAYWMDKDSGDSLEPTMFYPITKPLPPAPAIRKGQL